MFKFNLVGILTILIFISGCADIDIPHPQQIIKNPIGSSAVKLGMTRARVINIYGDPNIKRTVISDEWEEGREEWFYRARVDMLPVNAGYLSEDLYLYFDGDSLTNISNRRLGEYKKVSTEINETYIK